MSKKNVFIFSVVLAVFILLSIISVGWFFDSGLGVEDLNFHVINTVRDEPVMPQEVSDCCLKGGILW